MIDGIDKGTLVEIFTSGSDTQLIRTINGDMIYIDWLRMKEREFNKIPGRYAEIRKDSKRRVSLWANDLVKETGNVSIKKPNK